VKKYFVIYLFLFNFYTPAYADLVAHSISSTAVPAENVDTKNVLWLKSTGNGGRIAQASMDNGGNLRVTSSFPAGVTLTVTLTGTAQPSIIGKVTDENGITANVQMRAAVATLTVGTPDAVMLTGVVGKKIRVLGYAYFCSTTNNAATTANMLIYGTSSGNGTSIPTFGVGGAAEKASEGSYLFDTAIGDDISASNFQAVADIKFYLTIQYVLLP
jgi:hypothetical protein